jgi:succinate-semialdehyde dehydrogenase/glutarate-semialdehyde dehydrogenase
MKLPHGLFIGGSWCVPEARETEEVLNPATLEKIGEFVCANDEDVHLAIEQAHKALEAWRNIGGHERAKYLRKIESLIKERVDEYAKILVQENGKSLAEAKGEILYGASYFDVYAGEAQRIKGEHYSISPDVEVRLTPEPIGVVAAITPWNFPQAMLARKMAAALAAGCTMVAKPDSQTPYSALLLAEICKDAGLPAGVFNIVTGDAPKIGKILMSSPVVKKMSFTGSTRVGKILAEQSAETLKKLSLELGGNAPFIVFEDADLEAAVEGAMASKYRNSGQTCVCTNRFFVHKSVSEKFVSLFAKKLESLKMGNGLEKDTRIGPLINNAACEKIEELMEDAKSKGASITDVKLTTEEKGYFMSPKILSSVSKDSRIFSEEIFGPVSAVYEFSTEEEVIKLANETNYGLASYFFTKDAKRIHRVRDALAYGMVGVNHGRVSSAWAPFGGVKESGYGKEGGSQGLKEYQVEKMSMEKIG